MSDLANRLSAALSGSYTIERELGGGGMSQVFLAQDDALGRNVVIKVLHPMLAEGVSAERFQREIGVAAHLQQPNIVPVFAAGVAAGLPYYVMPFVRGESLGDRLARGPIPLAEAVGYLRDVARALAYAHGEGLVHRDIKPSNVLISGGAAMVTDFGIAKALQLARGRVSNAKLTETGTSIGTPMYMAPEQAAGDPGTDHRADLYSLGAMAYEVVSGRSPFADRATPQALLVAHLTELPEPLTIRWPQCPPALARLIMQCLEKDPAHRPASAAEVLERLELVPTPEHAVTRPMAAPFGPSGSGKAGPPRVHRQAILGTGILIGLLVLGAVAYRSARNRFPVAVAVLPFSVATDDSSLIRLGAGLAEDLRRSLRQVPGLAAITSGASERFADSRLPNDSIARQLGARAVIRTELTRASDRVNLTFSVARLNQPRPERFAISGTEQELLAARDSIVSGVLRAVGKPQSADEIQQTRRWRIRTDDPVAYLYYVRAIQLEVPLQTSGRLDDFLPIEASLDSAIARDPRFVEGYLEKSHMILMQLANYEELYSRQEVDSMRRLARDGVERALSIDQANPAAQGILGELLLAARDTAAALAALDRAIAGDSTNAAPFQTRCWVDLSRNPVSAGEPAMCRSYIARDSLNQLAWHALGHLLRYYGQESAAADAFLRASQLDPLNPEFHSDAGHALYHAGRYEASLAELRRAIALKPEDPLPHSLLAEALSGTEQVEMAITERRTGLALSKNQPAYIEALGVELSQSGQHQEALAVLRENLRLQPRNPSAHAALAHALWRAQQFDAALGELASMVALDSTNPQRWLEYASMLRLGGRIPKALAAVDRAQSLGQGTGVIIGRADQFWLTGYPAEAAVEARRAVAADSTSAFAWGTLSYLELLLRKPDSALAAAQRLLALDSTDASSYTNIALAEWMKHDFPKAIDAIEHGLRLRPFDRFTYAERIWLYANAGKRPAALAMLDSLERRYRRSSSSGVPLVIAMAGVGDTADAARQLRLTIASGDEGWRWLSLNDPQLESLRGTPEFQEARSRLGMNFRGDP